MVTPTTARLLRHLRLPDHDYGVDCRIIAASQQDNKRQARVSGLHTSMTIMIVMDVMDNLATWGKLLASLLGDEDAIDDVDHAIRLIDVIGADIGDIARLVLDLNIVSAVHHEHQLAAADCR